jgi:hypothetical protein
VVSPATSPSAIRGEHGAGGAGLGGPAGQQGRPANRKVSSKLRKVSSDVHWMQICLCAFMFTCMPADIFSYACLL